MKIVIVTSLGVLLLGGCTEKGSEGSAASSATSPSANGSTSAAPATMDHTRGEPPIATQSSPQPALSENAEEGTWTGQIAVAQPVSTFNYVGAESGDFAPMRFQNESEAGKKILGTCSDGEMCEFSGAVEWLDETPPPDASAVGRIVRVDSVKRGASATP